MPVCGGSVCFVRCVRFLQSSACFVSARLQLLLCVGSHVFGAADAGGGKEADDEDLLALMDKAK